jgi:hypothetical protein
LEEVSMQKSDRENEGMMKLLGFYKAMFRTPENMNHYSEADFKAAEKKFLKFILLGHESANSASHTAKYTYFR